MENLPEGLKAKIEDVQNQIPSELKLNEKWAATATEIATYSALGGLTGAGVGLVLFRGMASRLVFSAYSTGIGSGIGWEKASNQFEEETIEIKK